MKKLIHSDSDSRNFKNVECLIEDPMLRQKVSYQMDVLCNQKTRQGVFRSASEEIGKKLAAKFHASCEETQDKIAFVPVMTAGLWLVGSVLPEFPLAKVCCIGMERVRMDGVLMPSVYKNNLVGEPAYHAVILEPMLATGGSAVEAIRMVKEWGSIKVTILSVLAAPEGLRKINKAFPEANIVVAQIAGGLDHNSYIINPMLGDFGDRCAGLDLE